MTQSAESARRDCQEKWVGILQEAGAYWHHDGNLKRPYALLTGNKISNFYANCAVITKQPHLLKEAGLDLFNLFYREYHSKSAYALPDAVCGSAYGAITLAYELAMRFRAEAWFTVKGESKEMYLDRFAFSAGVKKVALAEDVITSFGTTRNSIAAIAQKAAGTGGSILPYVFALVNRSGRKEIDGFTIISLIEARTAKEWEPGQNPFLGKEPERVEPVRPKQNWTALTAEYPG